MNMKKNGQNEKTALPAAMVKGTAKFSHLVQESAHLKTNESQTADAVAARIIAAGKKRRGEI